MINKNRAGLVGGILAAVIHAVWALVVVLGIAQIFLDWIFPLHFLNSVYSITSFSIVSALLLVVMGFVGGYVSGWLFAAVVNLVYKE